MVSSSLYAQKGGGDEKDIRSDLPGIGTNRAAYSKYPQPFSQYNNPKDAPAVSTGYYFTDSELTGALETTEYAPKFTGFEDPDRFETERWITVFSGPRQIAPSIWTNNDRGFYFFRNPALPTEANGDFFAQSGSWGTDSTDDAFAGPMPLALRKAFHFNKIHYDSFYVSTNGILTLTNSRYTYDENGNRTILPGRTTAYNENSMDWFVAGQFGRNRLSGTASLNDPAADNFGYEESVLGGSRTSVRGGIRDFPRNGDNINSVIAERYRTPIIAPFWADMQVSQWDGNNDELSPRGRVLFKTDETRSYLTVFFDNFTFNTKFGGLWTPFGNVFIANDQRIGNAGPTPTADAQIFLDTRDETITIVYNNLVGVMLAGGRAQSMPDLLRWNSIAGVRGFARHVDYGRPGGPQNPASPQPAVAEYAQYTEYWRFERNPRYTTYPSSGSSVEFRQRQNTLRVEAIEYRVRSLNPNDDLDFKVAVAPEDANNYELFANELRLGSIQPVAIIQNLSNNIQGTNGVNFVRQDLDFQARFRVINKATLKNRYNSLVAISDDCLKWDDAQGPCNGRSYLDIDFVDVSLDNGRLVIEDKEYNVANPSSNYHGRAYDGLPPYEFVRVFFPPWSPFPDLDGDIGRMEATVTAEPVRNNGLAIGNDTWPFDDVAGNNLFVLRRLDDFYDDANEFHVVDNTAMPSVLKWVNIGAAVQPGEDVSDFPLPPRTNALAANDDVYNDYRLESPAIEMNRLDQFQNDWPLVVGQPAWGDILASFPIDIRDKEGAVLSVSIQRTKKEDSWDRGYSDASLVGPEPRVIFNGSLLTNWGMARAASRAPDSIVVEFARPSRDELENIVNIPNEEWRYLPRRGKLPDDDDAVERGIAALTVFGGGGYISPFREDDRDSILPPPTGADFGGLRPNIYDTGIDFGFNKYFIPIPDTFVNAPNNGGKNFRFRVRVVASNDQKCPTCIPDDSDNFYIDNVTLLEGNDESTDLEISKVYASWPYTQTPATQASEVPIRVQVSNNTSTDAPFYSTQVIIWRGGINQIPRDNLEMRRLGDNIEPVYCRKVSRPKHEGGRDYIWEMPAFNAQEAGPGIYTLMGIVNIPGGDRDIRNDTTLTEFEISFGDDYAYDPVNGGNEVGTVPGSKPGQGLGTFGHVLGGIGTANGYVGGYAQIPHAVGDVGGSGSGSIAMRFEVLTADTLYGYKAWFGEVNQAPDDIEFRLYNDNNGQPGQQIQEGRIQTVRGFDYIRTPQNSRYYFDEYVSYKLQDSVILQKGVYWISIVQLGQTSMELAASTVRGGQRTLAIDITLPIGPMGIAGISNNIHPEFRQQNDDRDLINLNFFALENTAGSGQWSPFSPPIGNGAYPHLDHTGRTNDNTTATQTRGFWIPLLRPIFGFKSSGTENIMVPCPEWIPVELTTFDAKQAGRGIEVYWETASERDNYGFYVERMDMTAGEDEFTQIEFVRGNGTTASLSTYNFTDNDLRSGHTYAYKLRQVDRDGSQTCYETMVQTVEFLGRDSFFAQEAAPNPFGATEESTSIVYELPASADVILEIVDMYGNTVNVLQNGNQPAGTYDVQWNADNQTGATVAPGNYLYRLSVDGEVTTKKIQYRK
ncbi:MAG: hypothetical protein Kapaf2KO_10550 [Candidatus Kapaibacteriales bacterium]